MNQCNFIGRLTADPELKKTTTGVSVTTFDIAVNPNYVPKGKESKPTYITLLAWREKAEFACRNFRKGSLVQATSKYSPRKYQKDGESSKRIVPEFTVVEFEPISGFGQNAGTSGQQAQPGEPPAAYSSGSEEDFMELDDDGDLPF